MTVLKRIGLSVLLVVALGAASGCTTQEIASWLEWNSVDPVAAQAHLDAYNAEQAAKAAVIEQYGACGVWHDLAISVGWEEEHWETVNRLMWRESKCTPDAYNRSGASGLMQIMPMWADDCGGVRQDLFDPTFNLRCARHILDVQGWYAWSTY